MKALKKWGQHFLKDQEIIKIISTEINKQIEFDFLIEIGPGTGSITKKINFHNWSQVYLIDIDNRMIQELKQKILNPNVDFINEDFLNVSVPEKHLNKLGLICGNLPYNAAAKIIWKFLTTPEYKKGIFMMQKEMYERFVAKVNTKQYNKWSVIIQWYCQITKIIDVFPESFVPKPKVNSVVFLITKNNNKDWDNFSAFYSLINQAFIFKRKTLKNNFKNNLSWEKIELFLAQNNYFPSARGEEIKIEDYWNMFLKI